MRNQLLAVLAGFLMTTTAFSAEGIISVKSSHNVKSTADKLESILKSKGMNVFARINHSAGAKNVDLELRPTEVLVFGNPKVGTPLMNCAQTVAIDLPQKALIYQDESGQTWLSYNDPQFLAGRHAIEGCNEVLQKITGALGNFAKAATQ